MSSSAYHPLSLDGLPLAGLPAHLQPQPHPKDHDRLSGLSRDNHNNQDDDYDDEEEDNDQVHLDADDSEFYLQPPRRLPSPSSSPSPSLPLSDLVGPEDSISLVGAPDPGPALRPEGSQYLSLGPFPPSPAVMDDDDGSFYPHNNPYAESSAHPHRPYRSDRTALHHQSPSAPYPLKPPQPSSHHYPSNPRTSSQSTDSNDQKTIAESTYLHVRDKYLPNHSSTYAAHRQAERHSAEKHPTASCYSRDSSYYGSPRRRPNHLQDSSTNLDSSDNKYPPIGIHSEDPRPPARPPVWKRIFWDTTPLDHRIWNHQQGIGVQDRAYVCYLLAAGMLIAMILELTTNAKYQGTPIAIKPSFNYMLGPSAEIMINTGARFTPCIKFVPNVSNISFPCLNETSATPTCSTSLESICGLGGFTLPGQPDQTFRFVLPMFLHAGLVHYAINMLVQLTSSALIERQMGSIRFLLLYIPSGVFGFILGGNFSLVGQPSVGASGALFSTHAAVLVDLIAHWSIEDRPGRKLGFLLFEIIAGLALGLIPGIDNFSHIGGFSMGLLLSGLLFPVLHKTRLHRLTFYLARTLCVIGAVVMFVVLYKNFFTIDPAASCNWCRYLSCWPTKANNRCQGTGLGMTETTVVQGSNALVFLALLAPKLLKEMWT